MSDLCELVGRRVGVEINVTINGTNHELVESQCPASAEAAQVSWGARARAP